MIHYARAAAEAAACTPQKTRTDMKKRKTHPRVGSHFEDFLRGEGRLEEATAIAIKRVLAWDLQRSTDRAERANGRRGRTGVL